jgi:hypothetical protein
VKDTSRKPVKLSHNYSKIFLTKVLKFMGAILSIFPDLEIMAIHEFRIEKLCIPKT